MDIRPALQLRTDQRMALLPQMLQSIEILQLAAVELVARVAEEMERNETLEMADAVGPEWAAELAQLAHQRQRDDDGDGDPWRPPRSDGEADGKVAMLANVPDTTESLLDFVQQQLAWAGLDPAVHDGVWLLAQHLDERGLLTLTDEEMAALLPPDLFEECLAVLQGFEPRGLGARSTAEALLLQIDADDPDRPDLEAILTRHLPGLARNRIPEVAKDLGLEPADIEALLGRLRRLEPRPAAAFREDAAEALRPDVAVDLTWDGQLEVRVDDDSLPALSVNADYAAMAKSSSTDADVRKYLADKVRTAKDLIAAVQHRKQTLVRVVAAVMTRQQDFLAQGRGAVRPLRMAEVADELGLHPSTISRAIAGKAVQTPQGILPLREFFDGGDRQRGGTFGRMGVKQRLGEVVAEEDPEHPLSDDELVARLAGHDIAVARRTVTKYRKELGIPSSWQRKRYGNR